MALSTQRASASFLSNESTPRWKYDVFLSFRGVDTRKGFVSHLYHELWECQGITTFFDDQELEEGTSIPLELLSAIKESHIAIVVLSPNYASSKWCLDELTTILQCMEARNSVLPVFYETDPSNVGNQRGSFAKAFAEHEEKFTSTEEKKKVTQWREDLKKVSKISGWHSKESKCERELIEKIVQSVWRKVQSTFTLSNSSQKFVRVTSRLEQLSLLLAHDANDVRFIGITGMGGIGKTTLAKLAYDKIFHHFEVHCFLGNIREVSKINRTLIGLQKRLLFPMLKAKIEEIWDEECGIIFIKKCLRNKKVLLVLDDVDDLKQLEVLAGNQSWFGMGSRIVITTRNEGLLVQHGIATSYKMQGLNDCEALELFCLNAFMKEQPEEDFLELFEHFLKYARGLPLVLKTLGSFLYTRGQDAWNSMLENIHRIPNPTIFNSLKISYDGLEDMEKRVFLDVACFHKGKCMQQLFRILDNSFEISSSVVIDLLIEKSLLTIEECFQYDNSAQYCIGMHDLIQEMAWTIVGQESKESGLRSRLWLLNDIIHILTTNTGTRAIEGIVLQLPEIEEVVHWNCEAFSTMHGLRFLEFDNLIISSSPKFLPCSLRIMIWSWYPSKSLPPSFHPRFLTELRMPHSKLVRLWDGKENFPKLKYIDLIKSNKLIGTPDFTGIQNLEELVLEDCTKLVEIHLSIAVLKKLKVLNLRGCKSIKRLPSEVEMDSLEYLDLTECSKVKRIPEFSNQMRSLSKLLLGGTAIEKLPSSIGHLVGLTVLGIIKCRNLLDIPIEICNLKSLKRLLIGRSLKIEKPPGKSGIREPFVYMKNLRSHWFGGSIAKPRDDWGLLRLLGIRKSDEPCWGLVLSSLYHFRCLEDLQLRYCDLGEGDIPDDIGCLSSLRKLNLCGNNFVTLPASIKCLSRLESLCLEACERLEQLPDLPSNSKLLVNVNHCTSLKRLSDPSKLGSRFANLYDFNFSSMNCITLVEDGDWINTIYSRIVKYATQGLFLDWYNNYIVCPGKVIPKWFNNQTVGHSLNVELPPQSCSSWMGIAFCVVFAQDKETLGIPAGLLYYQCRIRDSPWTRCTHWYPDIRPLVSEHLWVFFLRHVICHQEQFLFETCYCEPGMTEPKGGLNMVKKCGARLVYKKDLEELNRTLKILKRTHDYCEEAASSQSPTFEEHTRKRQKEDE
ncbi:TMV resistance protein N-like [Malus domestica]|uniref:TMV resistance protein N-like n=1 Tax=Malus domestica TaxID=3750 RepID=UPI0010AA9EAE|nr:TMV resistance protein N-like isoform X1 [Malus domestica]